MTRNAITALIAAIALFSGCATIKPAAPPVPVQPAGAGTTPDGFHSSPHKDAGGNPAKIGKVYVSTGQYDKAIVELDKALAANPKDFYSLNFRAEAWFRKGEVAKAMTDTTAAIEMRPDFADAYNLRGYIHLDGKQYDLAIADFDRALTYNFRHEAAMNHRGLARAAKGEYEKAITDYTQALGIDENYIEAWFNKGEACEKAGRTPEAIESYKAGLKRSTGKPSKRAEAAAERIKALGGQ